MYRKIKDSRDSEALQKDIDRLCNWEKRWQMKFNRAKCYAMHITNKKKVIETNYRIGGSILETVTNHTYLGVAFDNKLRWSSHIQNITSKGYQILGLLRRNMYSCTPNVKAIAYKTLVRPRLEYCASVWDPYQKDLISQLEAVQRRSARFVMKNSEQRASVTEMLQHLKWESLQHRRATQRLSLIYKSVHKLVAVDTDPYLTKSIEDGVVTRKCASISFNKVTTAKDCYKYSLFPRSFAEWNCLASEVRNAPTIKSFKSKLNADNLELIINKAHFRN